MFIKDRDGICHNVKNVLTIETDGNLTVGWFAMFYLDSNAGGGSFYLTPSLSTEAEAIEVVERISAQLGVTSA